MTTLEIVTKIKNVLLGDRRLKVREVAEIVNISSKCVLNILYEQLSVKRLYARWLPRLLHDEQNIQRVNISKECFRNFRWDSNEFLHRFIIVDET